MFKTCWKGGRRWGPWTMLVAVVSLLLLMGYSILNLL